MAADDDLIKLYSQRILALATQIPNTERLSAPLVTTKKRSPLCGSTVTVDLSLEEGRITEFGQDVKACALGQASAAIFGNNAVGLTRDDVAQVRNQLRAMLKQDGPVPDSPFGGYEVLVPARDYKNRHASIMLVLDATLGAFDEAAAAA